MTKITLHCLFLGQCVKWLDFVLSLFILIFLRKNFQANNKHIQFHTKTH